MDQKPKRHLFLEAPRMPLQGVPPPPSDCMRLDLEKIQSTLQVAYKEKSGRNSREIPNFLLKTTKRQIYNNLKIDFSYLLRGNGKQDKGYCRILTEV